MATPLRAALTLRWRGVPGDQAAPHRRARTSGVGGWSHPRAGIACAVRGYPRCMAPSERTRRAAGLDGLRALAALSVLCFHVWLYGFDNPSAVVRSSVFDKVMFET